MNEKNEFEFQINGLSKVQAKPGVIIKEEPDFWALLYDPARDISFGINPVCVYAWKKMQDSITVNDIVEGIKNHFSSVPEDIESDIYTMLQSLIKKELCILDNSNFS